MKRPITISITTPAWLSLWGMRGEGEGGEGKGEGREVREGANDRELAETQIRDSTLYSILNKGFEIKKPFESLPLHFGAKYYHINIYGCTRLDGYYKVQEVSFPHS